ncbi:TIGR04282 family arsenosugar biosynthesis glycosyltransferase [Rhodohalobacter mucosus]|uniref:DUF2064 domain-containing protein n=1 Tax=Rhodohalobacter mucosus TaxID=2079485 RepID=A0A316TST6_9BACT|nr:DUF2064 domain-containing protein [Rhodohalobacter mucosus]PWN05324.1 hypothetical protein DDZ15_14740 [Rhodohalobacter mucosus]
MQGFAHTAILLFSRTPESEARMKRLAGRSDSRNKSVQQVLWRQTLDQLRAAPLPLVVISEERQRGTGFAERFSNAIADVFALGYEQVIAVGGDCPHLHDIPWHDIAAKLSGREAVLGPTQRNGAYLIGLSRHQFCEQTFRSLPWQQHSLLDSLKNYFLKRSSGVYILRTKTDINTYGDLERYLFHSATGIIRIVRNLLSQILNTASVPCFPIERTVPRYAEHIPPRAPPITSPLH